jgi:hypothetical protein
MFGIDDAILGIGSIAMGKTNAYNQARQAQSQEGANADQMEMFKKRKAAYDAAQARGGQQQQAGEASFLNETGAPLAELGQAKQDVLSGGAEGLNQASGQMAANLATGGVRGGQAATQMRRGIGQMGTDTQRQINEMAVNDAQSRRQMRGGFFGQKASAGQQANLAMPGF